MGDDNRKLGAITAKMGLIRGITTFGAAPFRTPITYATPLTQVSLSRVLSPGTVCLQTLCCESIVSRDT